MITVVNFYSLSDYNGYRMPTPRRISTPISVIVTQNTRGVSDAQLELSQEQFATAKPEVLSFFTVDNVPMVFIITEIQQATDNGVTKYTLMGKEILGYYLSRRCPTLDTYANEGESIADFTIRMINKIEPIGASAVDIYKAYSGEESFIVDTEKIMGVLVGDGSQTPAIATKILNADETIMDWLLDEMENTDLYLAIDSSINTLYNNTDKAVFITAQLAILHANDQKRDTVYLPANVTTKEREGVEYIFTNTLKVGGPQGAYYPTDKLIYDIPLTTQDLSVTAQTEYYSGDTARGIKYSSLASPNIERKGDNGLAVMPWDTFCKYLSMATSSTVIDQDNPYVYITKTVVTGDGTTARKATEQAQIWLRPKATFKDVYGRSHTGVIVLCSSSKTMGAINTFYNSTLPSTAKITSGAVYLGRVYKDGFMWYKVGIWSSVPDAPVENAVPVARCDTTKNGGLDGVPKSLDFKWSDYRDFDITQNLNYCYPIALAAYEYKLAIEQKGRLTTDIEILATPDDLRLGNVVWVPDGVEQKLGFVSVMTESREDGEITKDVEITWMTT